MKHHPPDSPGAPRAVRPAVLMLGKGWFPTELGGLDRYFRDLFEALAETEWSATGIVVGPAEDPPDRLNAVSEHRAPLVRRLIATTRAVRREIDQVDVVDAHFALYGLMGVLLARARGVPVVVHFHGPWAAEAVSAGETARWMTKARRGIERQVYKRADAVVVLSSAFKRVLVEDYGVSPWVVRVERPGVDLTWFCPAAQERSQPERPFRVVAVRRLVPRMGLETLLDAWAQFVEACTRPVVLLMAGDGPLRSALESRVREDPRLASTVKILGRVSDEDLRGLYRQADVNVVPTIEHEGFGLVVLEAAACGTPSIVTDAGALPEVVAALDPSLVVPAAGASALAQRLQSAVSKGDLPSAVECRGFAETHGWPAVARRHADLYQRVREPGPGSQRRLRVVYLDHVARLSGGELALQRLLAELDGVEAHVILGEEGPLVSLLLMQGTSVEVLPLAPGLRDHRKAEARFGRVGPALLWSYAIYVFRLARRLRQLQPDLVHTNSLKAGTYGSVAAKLARVPIAWHVRDRIAPDYLPTQAIRATRWMIARLANSVITNSHSTMAELEPARDAVVGYSVVPEVVKIPAKRDNQLPGPLRFGVVGRFAPWKGQDVFIRAFALAFPDGPCRAVLVGDALFGEDDFSAQLHRLADELGVASRVEFRGFRENVGEEFARLDVLVHSSITAEPFGQVVVEGMAAGLPVVATSEGGPAEIITAGHDGLLYPPGDVDELAQILVRLAGNPEERQALGRQGRERALDFSGERIARQIMGVYARTLAGKSRTTLG